jgi:hypothetical protein
MRFPDRLLERLSCEFVNWYQYILQLNPKPLCPFITVCGAERFAILQIRFIITPLARSG